MTLKNSLRRSVLACATTSLLACGFASAQTTGKGPAIALIDSAEAPQWQTWIKDSGWKIVAAPDASSPDARILALDAAVEQAIQHGEVDPARVYLAGRGAAAAAIFYTISRVPDRWAAAIAIDGSPQPAIDTDRIFAANFTNVPVLWISAGTADQDFAARLKGTGLNIEWRSAAGLDNAAIFNWLASHRREEFPQEIDCETNSPAYARCYWIRITKFDAAERNDVLPSTRLAPAVTPSLDLGGFGYKPAEPGPGVLVSFLPEKYSGPLKIGDRIVALDGRPIADPKAYLEMMTKYTEEKPAVVAVQRGKDRNRVETRVVMPRRDASVTARVDAKYVPADKEIQIVSRTIKEMRVTIPPQWAEGAKLFWNGLVLEKIDGPGCFLLTVEKELLHAARCQ
jgi:dienelactone hydrolase